MFHARQGDVIIIQRSTDLPPAETMQEVPRDGGRVILAYGEVTGHSHAILEADVTMYLPEGSSNIKLLDAPTGATLYHDEHDPIALPPGKYDVFIQTEYHPTELRRVID